MFEDDRVRSLLGWPFEEIEQSLGESDEQGYDEWLGRHYYMLFQHEEDTVRFCSPEPLEDGIAVSIVFGLGQGVIGARVGLRFEEIEETMGTPDFSPDLGPGNLCYIGYFLGETHRNRPDIFVRSLAVCKNSTMRLPSGRALNMTHTAIGGKWKTKRTSAKENGEGALQSANEPNAFHNWQLMGTSRRQYGAEKETGGGLR